MKISKVIATTISLLAIASQGLAADAFDKSVANIALLQIKEVQTDVGITAAQRTQLNKHADWFNAESKKINDQAATYVQKNQQPPKSLTDKFVKLNNDMANKVVGVLTAGQLKRLREITLQNAGPVAMMDPTVAKKIGLSDSQLKSIRSRFDSDAKKADGIQEKAFKPIIDKYKAKKPKDDAEAKKLSEAYAKEMDAAGKKIAPQLNKIQSDFSAFLKKTLSTKQDSAWKALLGKPFKG
ncbi:MAG: hypothetical protein KDC26_07805 [Armatimonadetes bacterium]|nr:hypothetical protein [Armatimonadota bacterium]